MFTAIGVYLIVFLDYSLGSPLSFYYINVMTQSEKTWLKTTFVEEYYDRGRVPTGAVLAAYYEAERILTGADSIRKRSCNCAIPDLKKYVTLKFKKFLEDELHGS